MPKVQFKPQKVQINALQITRYTIVVFLARLHRNFYFPRVFHYNDIESDLSERTIRAILGILVGLEFLEEGYEDSRREKSYRFVSDRSLDDLICDFADIGDSDTDILTPIEEEK